MEQVHHDTQQECMEVFSYCRDLFARKLQDYGAAWRILRPESLTDQIYIKAERIRTLQIKGVSAIDEGIGGEFVGIVNYGIVGMIQLQLGAVSMPDLTVEEALSLYDHYQQKCLELLLRKNHDYGEAWRNMRLTSITDLILSKVHRTKQIEDHQGKTCVSEGIEANYMDMVNYGVFALILMAYLDE